MPRQGGRIVIWPAYFSSKLSRKDGRRVPRALAVANPTIEEIAAALDSLHLGYDIDESARYSSSPYRKSGRIVVDQRGDKEALLRDVAESMKAQRS